ncbi:hypothetical protein BGZ61DRAFT_127645 [Ilyonectria robusta]|uniref:uncharacterized protein n=1 Tax=Ilyonectria robusta TaxID=1079257 RepID=UPI001E8E641B|nr:uncharacterized protein BGZ61DRAFT_127645 [Ilyonectria robusta]KAH8734662.1 hypothetical protein BGZ61DRAFT_127645 [Ilyonectria robusta]
MCLLGLSRPLAPELSISVLSHVPLWFLLLITYGAYPTELLTYVYCEAPIHSLPSHSPLLTPLLPSSPCRYSAIIICLGRAESS